MTLAFAEFFVARAAAAGQDAPAATDLPMDQAAFAEFYERSARPLWAYLARASGDVALADDLTQESFVRFLCASGAEEIRERGEVAARKYLFRIGTNLLKDHWRRIKLGSLEDVAEEAFATAEQTASADTRAELGRALGGMRARDQQLLWLAYAEEYSDKEIAEITGLASASVRLLLFRARRVLAERLKDGR